MTAVADTLTNLCINIYANLGMLIYGGSGVEEKPISDFVSPQKASERLGVSVDTLRRWEAAGKIKAIRTPTGHRRYDMTSLVTGSGEVQTLERSRLIGEDTLHLLAKGLCEYEQQIPKRLSDYPAALQLGVDKLALACLITGVRQLQGVPDFVSTWAQRPLKDWDIEVDCPEEWHEQQLIEEQKASGFCIETAEKYFDEFGNFQKKIINEVMTKAAQDHDLYSRFRRYIIQNSVTSRGLLDVDSVVDFKPVKDVLRASYEKAPESYGLGGRFYCCGHCGGLMYLTKDDELKCENKHCAKQKKAPVPFLADKYDEVLWLKKDLRYFIHRPGKAELRLEERLKRLLEVKLYPELDKYDLHLVFPDGTVWAVDVKFWESAYNLAKKVDKPIPRLKHQPYHESFFVFPDEIKSYGQEYMQEFRSYCTVPLKKSQVMFEEAFIQKVIKKLERKT